MSTEFVTTIPLMRLFDVVKAFEFGSTKNCRLSLTRRSPINIDHKPVASGPMGQFFES